MCGIAGLFRPGGGDESRLSAVGRSMTEALAYRGPDAAGFWTNASAGIAFGHRRLAVIELSVAGAQPMRSDCGRLTVNFNGEIFNHLDMRAELGHFVEVMELGQPTARWLAQIDAAARGAGSVPRLPVNDAAGENRPENCSEGV